jgi:microcystin-dependent protein
LGHNLLRGKKMANLKSHEQASILGNFVPPGVIMPFAGATAPSGWFICDGSEKSETTYAALFAAIGTTWNTATNPLTGSTQEDPAGGNFRIPNLQGVFLRGVGDFAGSDAYSTDNDVTLAAFKVDQGQGHKHPVRTGGESWAVDSPGGAPTSTIGYADASPTSNTTRLDANTPTTDGTNGTPRVGKETNPKQVGVYYIIKY